VNGKSNLICPLCGSTNVKKRCCGGRRCNDCKHKWNVRKKRK